MTGCDVTPLRRTWHRTYAKDLTELLSTAPEILPSLAIGCLEGIQGHVGRDISLMRVRNH